MKAGTMMAILASLALIGGASWFRFFQSKTVVNTLTAVAGDSLPPGYYDQVLSTFLAASSTPAAPAEKLNTTDLVGRQLVIDYLTLAKNGGLGEESISALADHYAQGVATLTDAPKISPDQLKSVSNTNANFSSYAEATTEIYKAYLDELKKISASNSAPDPSSPQFYSSALAISSAYNKVATRLEAIDVPDNLTEEHAQWINLYLSDASALKKISETKDDPTLAFSALLTFQQNNSEEKALLEKINGILTSHGI